MNIFEEYSNLYEKYIVKQVKLVIVTYQHLSQKYQYRPYSHHVSETAIDQLSTIIIDNMVFYAFTEEEIVTYHKRYNLLDDLKNAAKFAYTERLPKRTNPDTDGTTGEVLLDLLIQVFEPTTYKLIARAKYKQMGDNSEIKGYDSLYFTKTQDKVCLWLGQVKTGSCEYCKSNIATDLNSKYSLEYLLKSIFYIVDKVEKNNPLINIINEINDINYEAVKHSWSNEQKKGKLFKLFTENNIEIIIPCVLAFTADIYHNKEKLTNEISACTQEIVKYFDSKDFQIPEEIDYKIIYYIFPIQDVKELRKKIVDIKTNE